MRRIVLSWESPMGSYSVIEWHLAARVLTVTTDMFAILFVFYSCVVTGQLLQLQPSVLSTNKEVEWQGQRQQKFSQKQSQYMYPLSHWPEKFHKELLSARMAERKQTSHDWVRLVMCHHLGFIFFCTKQYCTLILQEGREAANHQCLLQCFFKFMLLLADFLVLFYFGVCVCLLHALKLFFFFWHTLRLFFLLVNSSSVYLFCIIYKLNCSHWHVFF